MDHKAIARAALRRHDAKLARALQRAVDAGLPGLTPVDPRLPQADSGKTNPPTHAPGIPHAGAKRSAAPDRLLNSKITPRSVDERLPQLTSVDAGLPHSHFDKTNPPRSHDPGLSPKQLAAARMLVQGLNPSAVATHLKITRQGLWKWRRQPAFAGEIHRLHDLLARGAPR